MATMMTVKFDELKRLSEVFNNPAIQTELERLTMDKAIAGLIAQAIADNFDKQGPGWGPLKGETIRRSVGKSVLSAFRKQALSRMRGNVKSLAQARKQGRVGELNEIIGKLLSRHERRFSGTDLSNRAILRKTGLLMKSVTTPNAAHGIWPSQNSRSELVWGTNLIYAGVHNFGYPARNIPKREFLVIRQEWQEKLNDYVISRAIRIIKSKLETL